MFFEANNEFILVYNIYNLYNIDQNFQKLTEGSVNSFVIRV